MLLSLFQQNLAGGGGGGGGSTTWNPADKWPSIVLSNGNLTATHSGPGGATGVRSTTGKSSGKYVFKFSAMAIVSSGADDALSISPTSVALDDYGYNDPLITTMYFQGDVYSSQTGPVSTVSGATGPFYAIDFDNGTIRTSANGTTWNGPYTFPVTATPSYLYAILSTNTASLTLDPAPTGWTLAGFSNWDAPSGSNYTLTADAGSFAETGVAAFQAQTRASSLGAFALTGQAALQKVSRASAVGAFALTGVASNQALSQVAESGAFTLAGQDATLTAVIAGAGVSLPADVGTFTLSGVAATQDISTASNAAAFALTGVAANQQIARQSSAGAFTLSGVAALQKPTGASSVGSFTLAGVATFQRLTGSASAGAFVLTGNDAALVTTAAVNYTLAADSGAFVLTGQAVADPASAAPVRNTGGWLPETREARNKRKTRQRKERAAWDAIERDLAAAYAKAMGIPQETAAEVVAETLAPRDPEIVRRIAEQLAGSPDPAASQLLKQIEARLASLHGLLAAHVEAQAARMRDEEDAILALLLAA